MGVDLVVLRLAPVDRLHVERVPEHEWDRLARAEIGEPVPAEDAFAADDDEAEVPRSKIEEYLLSIAHPVGRAKAQYLISRGYDPEVPEVLEEDLKIVAREGAVRSTEATEWGTKYLVVGSLSAPDGGELELATVWIAAGQAVPVLVTAYPWRGGKP
jgi:hypothetical protein